MFSEFLEVFVDCAGIFCSKQSVFSIYQGGQCGAGAGAAGDGGAGAGGHA